MSLAPPTTASQKVLEKGVKRTRDGKVRIELHAFVDFLQEAGHVRLELASDPKGERGMQLTLAMAGKTVQATIPSEIIMEAQDFDTLRAQPSKLRSRFAKYRSLENPTVEELKTYHLPLYWNEEWLREKVDECRTFAEVSRTYAEEVLGVNATTIANYARDTFNWRMREETTRKRIAAMDEYEAAGGPDAKDLTQAELANKYDVSESTVNRWVLAMHNAYAAMLENHKALGESESLRAEFCAEHGVGEKMLARWLADGSEVFSRERVKQTKQRYYSKAEYENLRRIAREFYDQHNGRVDKSALARELQVDRSTVTIWVNSFDLEVESGQ